MQATHSRQKWRFAAGLPVVQVTQHGGCSKVRFTVTRFILHL